MREPVKAERFALSADDRLNLLDNASAGKSVSSAPLARFFFWGS